MNPAVQSASETPLRARETSAGAQFATWFGCTMPDRFAPPEIEYRQERETAALIDKNYRAYIYATGPDRVRYLNAVLTNDVREASKGHGVPSLLLNPQGHILAELEVYDFGERLLLVSYQMIRERLIETLDKYIIMDDVTLEDATPQLATLSIEGPRVPEILRELTGLDFDTLIELGMVEAQIVASGAASATGAAQPIPARVSRRSPVVPGAEFLVAREHVEAAWDLLLAAVRAHGGGPIGYATLSALRLEAGIPWFGYDFDETVIPHEAGLENSHISYSKGCYTGQEIVERVRSRGQVNRVRTGVEFVAREHVEAAWDLLLAAVRAHGGGPIGYATLSALRLEAGVPWFGYDFDETVIPHEAGLETSHISYSKGCYTGQEIVERVRSRGQVNRVRTGVEFSAPTEPGAVPERGTKLSVAGKEVGHVTRAAFSPAAGHPIAMAYLRREFASPGTMLESPAGAARVIALPIAR